MLLARHGGNRSLHNRFLSAHAYAPQSNAQHNHSRRSRAKSKHSKERGNRSRNNQCLRAHFVKQPAKEKRCHRIHKHRTGIKQRQNTVIKKLIFCQMHSHQRKIYKAESKTADTCKIQIKAFLAYKAILLLCLSFRLKDFRIRETAFSKQ